MGLIDRNRGSGVTVRSSKMLSAWVTGIVVASLLSGTGTMPVEGKDGSFGGGDGTLADPYVIEDVWDLQNMSGNPSAHYVLKDDIDASGTVSWNSGAGFVPVGDVFHPFGGSLDGQNHTIAGLFINRSATNDVGLFGYVYEGVVRSVGIVDCDMTGLDDVGGLVGCNGGTVSNSYATAVVRGANAIGGLVGFNSGTVDGSYATGDVIGSLQGIGGLVGDNNGGTISNSHAMARVSGSGHYVGGLAGEDSGTVTGCYATGKVSGISEVGGLVGYVSKKLVSDCYATGDVNGTHYIGGLVGYVNSGGVNNSSASGNVEGTFRIGGLVGTLDEGVISASHARGNATATDGHAGGLVGFIYEGAVSDSYSMGNVVGNRSAGGLVGVKYNGTVDNSHYDIDRVLINGGHAITLGGLYSAQYQDWLSNDLSLRISDYSTTLVPSGECYEIGSVQGLRDFLGFADARGYKFCLEADLDLSAYPGLYIPYLAAEFDGANHTISNLYIDLSFADRVGMFGHVDGGCVKNTSLVGVHARGFSYVGGLVGYMDGGMVSGSSAAGQVTGIYYAGGLVGKNYKGAISSAHATGSVNGTYYVGGLVGSSGGGTVSDCYTVVDVSGNETVGGLIGSNAGMVSDCHAAGDVNGIGYYRWEVGGLLGQFGSGTVARCYATGDVSANEHVNRVGGLVGTLNKGFLSGCYATGNVSGGRYVGGLVGENNNGNVSDCYATGNTSGSDYVGGLAGQVATGTMWSCYAIGSVSGHGGVGGFVGYTIVKMPNCLWDVETSGQSSSSGGTGKTTGEMKTRRTFTDAGWDFIGTWFIVENVTYPLLKWQDVETPRADAGPDRTVDEGTLVTFDGSGSSDNFGIGSCSWAFMDRVPVTLYGLRPAYRFDNPGTFVVTLNVTDTADRWSTDSLVVTVNDVTAPAADAGPDQNVDIGALVTFDGSNSSDNAGIINYTWTLTVGTPVALHGARPTYRFDAPGVFVVTLNVTDAAGHWCTDTMTVTVSDMAAPTTDAGPDQTVDEGTLVTFDGTGSSDNIGVMDHAWTFTDGGLVTLRGARPTYRFETPGAFVVTLTVTDAAGNWATDSLTVTVNDITPPSADAGPDQILDEGARVTLDGRGSTDNVGIVNYTWLISYGNETVPLYGISVSFTSTMPDIYSVVLRVSDAAGYMDEDAMTLTVRDVTAPVAVAGTDRTVPARSTVSLNGSSSVDNVRITNHTWTFSYNGQTRALQGAVVQFTFDKGGVYEVILTVTDAAGNLDSDTVVITVVDTGRVTGTVLDGDDKPVRDAKVEIVSSDGKTYNATTAANGSFAVDVHHGPFTWKVSKTGYKAASGSSSVGPMGSTELELSDKPLVKDDKDGPGAGLAMAVLSIGLATIVAASRRRP